MMAVRHASRRARLGVEDWLRTHNASRLFHLGRFCSSAASSDVWTRLRGLEALAVALPRGGWRRRVVQRALALARNNVARLEDPTSPVVIRNAILLKPHVSKREKGLLLVSFETELLKLARSPGFERFSLEYRLLFLPTWQPFFSTALFIVGARARDTFWILPSSTENLDDCPDLAPHARGLPFQASSWVDDCRVAADRAGRPYDLLMVANFAKYKRHWRLFQALRELPPSISCVIAGRPLGSRSVEALRREAEAFGVLDRIVILQDPDDATLEGIFAKARLFCALSHKEGSYVAIAEALMADTPVAMFANAIVGSKEYIHEETGFLFTMGESLSRQLLAALGASESKRPRAWAQQNISARLNSERLNKLLESEAVRSAEEWTIDVESFHCRHFEFRYYDPSAETRLAPCYADVRERFGLDIRRAVV